MHETLTLLLAAGATLRLTRLAATDTITAPIRNRLSGWLLTGVTCGWCVSMWISVPVATSWWAWADHPLWQVAALALTSSWLAGSLHFTGQPARHEIMPVGPVTVLSLPDRDDGDTVPAGGDE